jgi:hypothetical protein
MTPTGPRIDRARQRSSRGVPARRWSTPASPSVARERQLRKDAPMSHRANARRSLLLVCLALACAGVVAGGTAAEARPRPRAGRAFEANKTFGLGLMLGAPTGLSGKYFLSSSNALDFGVGAIGYYRGRDGLHLHMDYLWHPVSLASTPDFELPLYFGIGGRFFDFDDANDQAYAFGVRAPLGIAFDFTNTPLDVFLELALVVDFFSGYRDNVGAELDGAVGIRYYFR